MAWLHASKRACLRWGREGGGVHAMGRTGPATTNHFAAIEGHLGSSLPLTPPLPLSRVSLGWERQQLVEKQGPSLAGAACLHNIRSCTVLCIQ